MLKGAEPYDRDVVGERVYLAVCSDIQATLQAAVVRRTFMPLACEVGCGLTLATFGFWSRTAWDPDMLVYLCQPCFAFGAL